MQFILMHKMNDELEKGLPPRPEEMAAIGAMMGEAVKKGLMRGGEGLKPTAQRLHLAYVDGKRTMKTPPFEGRGELVAAYALFVVRSKEEALACCDRYAAAAGDVELFLGPVVENWDLGFAPKPDDAPLRFLITRLADARSESDAPMDPKLDAVLAKMTTEGTLQTSGRLKSSKRGTRIRARGGVRRSERFQGGRTG